MLICPDCDKATLKIVEKIELGPDNRSDELAYQLLLCRSCGTHAVGLYEESRRGSFGEEHVHHTGFRIDMEIMRKLSQLLAGKDKDKITQAFEGHMKSDEQFLIKYRPY